jgi:gliding motility-associated-like protein
VFSISSTTLKSENFSIQIFNRWGNLIFKSNNKNFEWDGKYKGGVCSASTYYYILVAENINNEKIIKKGLIQ